MLISRCLVDGFFAGNIEYVLVCLEIFVVLGRKYMFYDPLNDIGLPRVNFSFLLN